MTYTTQANKSYVLIALSLNFAPPEQIFRGTQVSEQSLSECESIDIQDAIKIVHNVNRCSNTTNWAALLGNHLGVASHGPVGYATVSAPSVGKALSTFVEWYQVRIDCYTSNITEEDKQFEIVIAGTTGDAEYDTFFFEAFMRAFEILIALLTGNTPVEKTGLEFKTEALNRKSLMVAEYQSTLSFGKDENKLIIPKTLWYTPSPLYDRESHELNLRKCRQLFDERSAHGRIDMLVRGILRQHFEAALESESAELFPPQLKDICVQLHLTERTLIRQLKKYDTAYRKVLEDERKAFAKRLLQDARYTVFRISDILGYKEPANFCRAFKQWYSLSPSVYRRSPTQNAP